MRLTIIGCSGSVPGPDSPASCYLVEHDGFRVLLDIGHGAFGELQRYVDPGLVDAILLSHLHADHCADLPAFPVWRKHGPGNDDRPFQVLAPDGHGLETSPFAPSQQVGPFTVTTARVAHPVEAYAMRLAVDGHVLTYSGDTGPCSALVDLARGSDVLLAEASYVDDPDNPPDLHLTGREAGEAAAAAEVGRLVVTHVPPWFSREAAATAAAGAYDGPVLSATPGLAVDV
jgi:ribonuclease BN (tRNA processing enzyme)